MPMLMTTDQNHRQRLRLYQDHKTHTALNEIDMYEIPSANILDTKALSFPCKSNCSISFEMSLI